MDSFKQYLKKAKEVGRIDFEDEEPTVVLRKLGLLKDNHLLNAGVVLFCDTDLNDVQIAKFATDVRLTFTDIKKYTSGSIINLIRICEQYLIDAMDWKADIVGFDRVETPEVPVEALREAIINSYGHRKFGDGQTNEIVFFKNRIEIHNPGAFPSGYEPADFLVDDMPAIRRNKLITRTLYFIEICVKNGMVSFWID